MRALRYLKYPIYLAVGLLLTSQVALSVAAVYMKHTDHQLLVIIGGSMEPVYSVGDALILDTDTDTINNGDIVTYHDGPQNITTHRVISQKDIDGVRYLQTQGDANKTPDPNLTPADAVIGLPVAHIPDGGRISMFLSSRDGRLLTYGPALLLVIALEIRHLVRTGRPTEPDIEPDIELDHGSDPIPGDIAPASASARHRASATTGE